MDRSRSTSDWRADRRSAIASGGALGAAALVGSLAFSSVSAQGIPTFDVTDARFGADPSGRRDSTSAFQVASAAINAAGGGRLVVPPGSYRVGRQVPSRNRNWSFAPDTIIDVRNCTKPVEIIGNGAKLFVTPGLRFGSFEPDSGNRFDPRLPFTDTRYRATPYLAMILLVGNRADVSVSGFELAGGSADYRLGGRWNDHGIQINNSGIEANGNRSLRIENVYSHHHGLDGISIGFDEMSLSTPACPHLLSGCRFEDNGRQGLSWVGGNSLDVSGCNFSRNGVGRIASAPGAGVDIEPESSVCLNARFQDCVFSDNGGAGMVAHLSGPCENHEFIDCRFVGTRTWSAWPAAPVTRFTQCIFVGGVTNAHADPNPARACLFDHCTFTADSDQAPRGEVYSQNYLTVEMDALENVRFDACSFEGPPIARKGLIYANGGMFRNCRFLQRGTGLSVLRSTLKGTTIIDTLGTVDMNAARLLGPTRLNGKSLS